ncbi:MFS transporter [Streptomycetaceae bacterium NBC_01309]
MQGAGAGTIAIHAAAARPVRPRVIRWLLVAVAGMYVATPAIHGASVPLVQVELGLTDGGETVARIVGTTLAMVTLAVAGRAADVRGRRSTLTVFLVLLAVGCLMLTVAFSAWFYVLSRVLVTLALAGVFVNCLSYVATASMPGRIDRATSAWLAAMSLVFVAAVNIAPRVSSIAGWRAVMAATTVVVVVALLLVRRYLPVTRAKPAGPLPDRARSARRLLIGVLAAAGLQLGPVLGWADARVGALLLATGALLMCERLCAKRRATHLEHAGSQVSNAAYMTALAAGIVLGFTHVALSAVVPALTVAAGATAQDGTLVVSSFGIGGAVGCLLIWRCGVRPLTGGSLGLPLAALGLVLLHSVPARSAYPVASGCVVVFLIGLGIMLALTPQLSWFLSLIPRRQLGTHMALVPGAILLGTAAANAFPYTTSAPEVPLSDGARDLLWATTAVVAAAAMFLGRAVVAVAVIAAAAVQYALTDTLPTGRATVFIALGTGAAAGAVAWARREQSDRLAHTREVADAMQHAVLRPIPDRLGRLRMASLYRPSTGGTDVGGDFLEALHTPYGTRILIGDVRGKGLRAVQTVTDLLGCFRTQAYETPELGELVARLDRQVMRAAEACGDTELFATALVLQDDESSGELRVVNCGHLAPVSVGRRHVRPFDVPVRLPLGFGHIEPAAPLPAHTIPLEQGATIVVHTDGLSEARNSSGEFYPLTRELTRTMGKSPEDTVLHLDAGVRDWTHHVADDIAVVCLTLDPVPAAAASGTGAGCTA